VRRAYLQALALLPIPIVAGLVVVAARHQHHELPVLPGAGPAAGHGGAAPLTLPPAPAPGWKQEGLPVRYDEKTLFDRIDGAAPVYIRAGFVSSIGGEYRREGAKEPIIYDVYNMGSGRQALGMYATERDPSYKFVPVGDEGYLASGSLNFWRGRCYVKLAGQEQGEEMDKALLELAGGLAKALPAAPELKKDLELVKRLPGGQLPNSLGYSRPPLGDVDGLGDVYYAEYKAGEARYRLFIAREASPAAAAGRFEKAKAYFEKDKARAEETREGAARVLQVRTDSTATLLVLSGDLLAGGVDLPQAALVSELQPALTRSLTAPAPINKEKEKP
jgi:hypothetical protein